MKRDELFALGWNDFFEAGFRETSPEAGRPARVMSQGQGHYLLQTSTEQTLNAAITTDLRRKIKSPLDYPTVGDWVVMTAAAGDAHARVLCVLARKSCLTRTKVGARDQTQLIAANVDHALIVTSANADFDLDRLARYVAMCRAGGATPVLLLTKIDLCPDPSPYLDSLRAKFSDLSIHASASTQPETLAPLRPLFAAGRTVVLLGSSGVGKSTLTNGLLGFDGQKTGGVGLAAKGRHTTTARTLRFTRWGGLVIDTPGMQDVAPDPDVATTDHGFGDLDELVLDCKFTSCRHVDERGCAVQARMHAGELSVARWAAYLDQRDRGPGRRSKTRR